MKNTGLIFCVSTFFMSSSKIEMKCRSVNSLGGQEIYSISHLPNKKADILKLLYSHPQRLPFTQPYYRRIFMEKKITKDYDSIFGSKLCYDENTCTVECNNTLVCIVELEK